MIAVCCSIQLHERSITREVDQGRLRGPARDRAAVELEDALDVLGPRENRNAPERRNLEREGLTVMVAAPFEKIEWPVRQPGPLKCGWLARPGRQAGSLSIKNHIVLDLSMI